MKDLTQGKTFKTLFLYALPLVIAGLISQSYNLVDLIIAGKLIGDNALSATGVATTFLQFLSSIFWGCGVAIATRVGKLYGEKNNPNIVNSVATSILATSIMMVVLCSVCIIGADFILGLLRVDPIIYEEARAYFIIYVASLFFQSIHYQIVNILQALGDSKYPMVLTLISGFSNVILNIVFVAVFHMGVSGLAFATLLSCVISMIFGLFKVAKYMLDLGGRLHLHIYKHDLKQLIILSIPCVTQQISLYLSGVIIQPLINDLGASYSGGYSLAMNVNLVFNAIYHGVSRTVLAYSAQSLGAKKYDNFDKGIKNGLILQVLFDLPLVLFTFFFPSLVFSLFLQNKTSDVMVHALPYISYCLPYVFVCAYGNLMHSFFKSVRQTNTVVVTTLLFTIVRVVLAYTLGNVMDMFNGIYLSLTLAWVFEAIVLVFAYFIIFKNKVRKWKENM